MARIFFLLAFVAAAFAGSSGSASAQLFAGTVDCRASGSAVSLGGFAARCVFWPIIGIPTVSMGNVRILGRVTPLRDARAVWTVYSSGVIVPGLQGLFVRTAGTGTWLVGSPANLIQLRPAEDVPGEDVGRNLAPRVVKLSLQ
jgi:hypothetical protein